MREQAVEGLNDLLVRIDAQYLGPRSFELQGQCAAKAAESNHDDRVRLCDAFGPLTGKDRMLNQ